MRARHAVRTTKTSSIDTRAKAPRPSSRTSIPSREALLEGSSSVQSTASLSVQASPTFSAITRPTVYAEQHMWEYPSSDGIRSHYHRETAAENDFGKPQPLTYAYNTFMSDMQSMEQQSINVSDHNEYVEPIMARERREYGFIRAPPYPLHGHDTDDHSKGAMQGNSSGSLRQPTAEDFLRSNHPLTAPPTEEYNSDQDVPVIEPDSYVPEGLKDRHLDCLSQQSVAAPKRHYTTAAAAAKASRISQEKPKHKRARSELIAPSHAPSLEHEPSMSEHHSTPVRVPTISSGIYQPALGGLQRVSGVRRRNSKRDRVKRFVKDLCPFRHERKFGRPQN